MLENSEKNMVMCLRIEKFFFLQSYVHHLNEKGKEKLRVLVTVLP